MGTISDNPTPVEIDMLGTISSAGNCVDSDSFTVDETAIDDNINLQNFWIRLGRGSMTDVIANSNHFTIN